MVIDATAPVNSSFFGNLVQSFTPNRHVAVVRIAAGPYGRLNWASPGIVAVDGRLLGFSMENPNQKFLSNEYIAECVKGFCPTNSGIIFSADQIMGTPLSK